MYILSTKKNHLFILFFTTLFHSIIAQTGFIKGVIKDKDSQKFLENTFVNINRTNNHSHSDDKGFFLLSNILFGKYELEFEKSGYEKQTLVINITSIDTINLEALLVSKSINLTEIDIARKALFDII